MKRQVKKIKAETKFGRKKYKLKIQLSSCAFKVGNTAQTWKPLFRGSDCMIRREVKKRRRGEPAGLAVLRVRQKRRALGCEQPASTYFPRWSRGSKLHLPWKSWHAFLQLGKSILKKQYFFKYKPLVLFLRVKCRVSAINELVTFQAFLDCLIIICILFLSISWFLKKNTSFAWR